MEFIYSNWGCLWCKS